MAQQLGIHDTDSAYGRYADAFVIFSVTVLSMALGAWFLFQLELSLWPGMAAALTVYTVLLLFHLAIRRRLAGDGEESVEDERMEWIGGEHDLPSFATEMRKAASASGMRAASDPTLGRPDDMPAPGPHTLPDPSTEVAFHYRPRDAGGPLDRAAVPKPPNQSPSPAATQPLDQPVGWQEAGMHSPSEKNVELIQDLIKKLADELSETPAAPPPSPSPQAREAEDDMIARSLAALDTAAASMRAAIGDPPPGTGESWWPGEPHAAPSAQKTASAPQKAGPSAPPPPNAGISRAAEAIAANRMEVFLEPIQDLGEGRARHFEITSRFLATDGGPIELAGLHGTGLFPRMDAARVVRAARVALKLGERGREGTVLTPIASESLIDPGFIDAATMRARSGSGISLALSVAQGAVRTLSEVQTRGLNALRVAGYRFALQDIADLNMDFGALRTLGFGFVRLDAPVFLEGLAIAGSRVPASDLGRYFADFGLTLIVSRIEDDWMHARILGFGVQYGMGGLFGGPKLVKAEIVGESAAA